MFCLIRMLMYKEMEYASSWYLHDSHLHIDFKLHHLKLTNVINVETIEVRSIDSLAPSFAPYL